MIFAKSKDTDKTNYLIPGPPEYIINNKVDYKDDTLPVEFNKYQLFNTNVNTNNTA